MRSAVYPASVLPNQTNVPSISLNQIFFVSVELDVKSYPSDARSDVLDVTPYLQCAFSLHADTSAGSGEIAVTDGFTLESSNVFFLAFPTQSWTSLVWTFLYVCLCFCQENL